MEFEDFLIDAVENRQQDINLRVNMIEADGLVITVNVVGKPAKTATWVLFFKPSFTSRFSKPSARLMATIGFLF